MPHHVPARGRAYQVFGKRRRDCSLDVFFPLRPVFIDLHHRSSSSFFALTTPTLFVVHSCMLSVTSTRWRDFVSDRSASVESHIYVSCVGLFLIVGINLCIAKLLLFPTVKLLQISKDRTKAMAHNLLVVNRTSRQR
jgi:hypothetical protein